MYNKIAHLKKIMNLSENLLTMFVIKFKNTLIYLIIIFKVWFLFILLKMMKIMNY